MGFLIKQIFGFLKILNSETGTSQIASGIAVGFILGMSPGLSIQTLLIFICIFVFRIQGGAAFISAAFFALTAHILDPIFHKVGVLVLNAPQLKSAFTTMYNMPIVPMTQFNNSVVMGSGVVAIVLSPFIYFLSLKLVKKYRVTVVDRIKKTKLWRAIKATSIYKWYYKYNELYN